MQRSELAIKGSAIGFVSQIVSVLMKFIVRTFVIRYLGQEVLGLDSVLIDTISMLSLAEMGISSAMIYRMYVPVISNDRQRINELMATYKRIYHFIALVVASVGVLLSFTLKWIIKDINISWTEIYVAFYLQLASSAFSYLLSYQRLLLEADQKKHVCILVDLISNVVFSLLKIVLIVVTKRYLMYLAVNIVHTITANVVLRQYSHRKYTFLKSEIPIKEDIKLLLQDTKHLLGNKLAAYVYSATDNLIISIFMGTGIVGLLSNYKYIANALRGLVGSTMSTIQPLLGNYLNSDINKEDSFRTLQRYTFIRYSISGATAIPLITISHSFVKVWTGNENYVMSTLIPVLLAGDYYIACVYGPLGEYISGLGMFRAGKYAMYAGAISNIVFSLIGVKLWGVYGVLGGTVISQLVIWVGDSAIVLRNYYREHPEFGKIYIMSQIQYLTVICITTVLSLFAVSNIIVESPLLLFILGGIVTETIYCILFIICFHKKEEFGFMKDILLRILYRNRS